MNLRQNNKLNSYTRTEGVLDANKQIYETYVPIVETVGIFKGLVTEIRTYGSEQTIDYTGVTDEKTLVKQEMAQEASDLALSGMSYARKITDPVLVAHFDYSFSDIRYATNNKAAEITDVILSELKTHLPNLESQMVYQEDVDNLERLLNRFMELTGISSDKHSNGVATTKKVGELFQQTDDLLKNELDALVTCLRKKHPMFFDAYMNARQIIDLGTKSNQTDV